MRYTRLAGIVAALAFVIGMLSLAVGLCVATGTIIEPTPGAYLGTKTSGQWIDNGVYTILFAIVLGVLTDISNSIAATRQK